MLQAKPLGDGFRGDVFYKGVGMLYVSTSWYEYYLCLIEIMDTNRSITNDGLCILRCLQFNLFLVLDVFQNTMVCF